MVPISTGEFLMGSPISDPDGQDIEKPQHKVLITEPFKLGKYLVTQEQWKAVMGDNPSQYKNPRNPVENMSLDDIQKFLEKLNAKLPSGAGKYQLPTEQQWEYACRAGSSNRYYFGDDESKLRDYAWYKANSDGHPHPVGLKKPNAWGLYDMLGNVNERCLDWSKPSYSTEKTLAEIFAGDFDKRGPARGGSFNDGSTSLRAAARNCFDTIDLHVRASVGGQTMGSDQGGIPTVARGRDPGLGFRVCQLPPEAAVHGAAKSSATATGQ
jgi:formylglycine-generating enzyme required for sulfatase activity